MRGQPKKACDRFKVRAKQLSRVLTGRKYLGGTQAKKHKATDEPPVSKKEGRHLNLTLNKMKTDHDDITSWCIQRKTIVSPSLHKSSQHLVSSSHPASAPSSSTGGTRQDSLITSPMQPPAAAFPPPEPCVTVCHTR